MLRSFNTRAQKKQQGELAPKIYHFIIIVMNATDISKAVFLSNNLHIKLHVIINISASIPCLYDCVNVCKLLLAALSWRPTWAKKSKMDKLTMLTKLLLESQTQNNTEDENKMNTKIKSVFQLIKADWEICEGSVERATQSRETPLEGLPAEIH